MVVYERMKLIPLLMYIIVISGKHPIHFITIYLINIFFISRKPKASKRKNNPSKTNYKNFNPLKKN